MLTKAPNTTLPFRSSFYYQYLYLVHNVSDFGRLSDESFIGFWRLSWWICLSLCADEKKSPKVWLQTTCTVQYHFIRVYFSACTLYTPLHVIIERFRSLTHTYMATDMITIRVSVATQINSSFAIRHDYSLMHDVLYTFVWLCLF